jgi:hypothetical protein
MSAPHADHHRRQAGRGKSWRDYVPLLVVVVGELLS